MNQQPMNVVLVIDTSSVMKSKPSLMQSAYQTVSDVLMQITPPPLISIFTYDNYPQFVSGSSDATEISKYFQCAGGGMSNCHKALDKVAESVREFGNFSNVVVIVIAASIPTDPASNLSSEGRAVLEKVEFVLMRAYNNIHIDLSNVRTLKSGTESGADSLINILRNVDGRQPEERTSTESGLAAAAEPIPDDYFDDDEFM